MKKRNVVNKGTSTIMPRLNGQDDGNIDLMILDQEIEYFICYLCGKKQTDIFPKNECFVLLKWNSKDQDYNCKAICLSCAKLKTNRSKLLHRAAIQLHLHTEVFDLFPEELRQFT